jgi:hypothetical protein
MTMKSCSGTGKASMANSFTGIAPTPSLALATSMDVNQSLLLGAILAGGLPGGSIPAAPAGAADKEAAVSTPTDARTHAAVRKPWGDVSPARTQRVAKRVTRSGVVVKGRPSLVCTGVVVMHPS